MAGSNLAFRTRSRNPYLLRCRSSSTCSHARNIVSVPRSRSSSRSAERRRTVSSYAVDFFSLTSRSTSSHSSSCRCSNAARRRARSAARSAVVRLRAAPTERAASRSAPAVRQPGVDEEVEVAAHEVARVGLEPTPVVEVVEAGRRDRRPRRDGAERTHLRRRQTAVDRVELVGFVVAHATVLTRGSRARRSDGQTTFARKEWEVLHGTLRALNLERSPRWILSSPIASSPPLSRIHPLPLTGSICGLPSRALARRRVWRRRSDHGDVRPSRHILV
jgi:hypothetical protein